MAGPKTKDTLKNRFEHGYDIAPIQPPADNPLVLGYRQVYMNKTNNNVFRGELGSTKLDMSQVGLGEQAEHFAYISPNKVMGKHPPKVEESSKENPGWLHVIPDRFAKEFNDVALANITRYGAAELNRLVREGGEVLVPIFVSNAAEAEQVRRWVQNVLNGGYSVGEARSFDKSNPAEKKLLDRANAFLDLSPHDLERPGGKGQDPSLFDPYDVNNPYLFLCDRFWLNNGMYGKVQKPEEVAQKPKAPEPVKEEPKEDMLIAIMPLLKERYKFYTFKDYEQDPPPQKERIEDEIRKKLEEPNPDHGAIIEGIATDYRWKERKPAVLVVKKAAEEEVPRFDKKELELPSTPSLEGMSTRQKKDLLKGLVAKEKELGMMPSAVYDVMATLSKGSDKKELESKSQAMKHAEKVKGNDLMAFTGYNVPAGYSSIVHYMWVNEEAHFMLLSSFNRKLTSDGKEDLVLRPVQ